MHLPSFLTGSDGDDDARWRTAARRLGRFLALLWGEVQQNKLIIRASGLAYITLLNVVPLVAVLFALLAAFGALEGLKARAEQMLFSLLVPTHQDEITTWINQFTENASSLGFLGFLLLIVTTILLLDSIESNFNDIWHVRQPRRFVSKITSYTAVLVLGSVLIGASLSISARVQAMLLSDQAAVIAPLTRTIGWLLPILLTFVAFTLMYVIVPNTTVALRHAAVGAAVSSVAWEAGKHLFASSVGQSVQYNTLYGSLAVIPIFLVWIYITWIIILAGLEIAYTRQHLPALLAARRASRQIGWGGLGRVIASMIMIARDFDRGAEPPSLDELAERSRVPTGHLETDMRPLFDSGVIREASRSDEERGLVPGRPLDRLTVGELIATVLGLDRDDESSDEVGTLTKTLLQDYREGGDTTAGSATLEEVLQRLS